VGGGLARRCPYDKTEKQKRKERKTKDKTGRASELPARSYEKENRRFS
jgi:hypothetical protein